MKKRGYDNLKTILIGSGGCGKSLMLQYLFLKAAANYSKTGVLPIFLELRYFTQGDELIPFIVNAVHSRMKNLLRMLLSSCSGVEDVSCCWMVLMK